MAARQRKQAKFVWSDVKNQALDLILEGRKTLDAIALDCAVSPRTLDYWVKHPDFQAALTFRRAHLIESLDGLPYIRKERRLIGLAQMAESARREYEARPWLREIRPTPDGELVNEHFNRDAHAAFRESLNDIAKELGERSTNVKVAATVQHGLLPAPEDRATLAALRDHFQDRPDVLNEIAAVLIAASKEAPHAD